MFAHPRTSKPYHQEETQKKHIAKAPTAAGITMEVGWKTFRHSYRSWLDETNAPGGVQRELMCHASIQTTMIVYGQAMTDSKRKAHNNVVQTVLNGPAKKGREEAEEPPVANVVLWSPPVSS